MSWDELIPLFTLLTSLVPAAIISFLPDERVRTRTAVNLAGATLKLALIAVMLWGVSRDRHYEFRFPVLPGLDFVLRADALAMFFVTLSGLLWFLTTVYAIAYLEGSPHRSRFFGFFSLCVGATVGIALAGNLFTFIMFYELLTLSTYPLVVHRETEVSRRAGRAYLVYTFAGGALLLSGAVWLHALVPTVDFAVGRSLAGLGPEHQATLRVIFVMLIAGVGVKAALVPLHGWLPQAMVAPAPVTALLHAVAVVKAGAFGIVRIVYDVYGIDRAHALGVTLPLAFWASATIVYGSVRALYQDDLKRRLAYSTVSQVSYIALGVALAGPSSTVGGVVHLVHQGLMKITLFFCAGNLAETLGVKKISEMHGVGRRMPWTMTAFTVGALGMIGVPPSCGFISKWYLGAGAIEASQYWVLAVLGASSALNAAYFLPVLYVVWFGRDEGSPSKVPSRKPHGERREDDHALMETSPRDQGDGGDERETKEARWGLLLPPLVTAALAVGVGLMAGTPFSPLQWALLIAERTYVRAVSAWTAGDAVASFSFLHFVLLATLIWPLLTVCWIVAARRLSRGRSRGTDVPPVVTSQGPHGEREEGDHTLTEKSPPVRLSENGGRAGSLAHLGIWMASLAALPALVLALIAEPGTSMDLPWLLLHMHLGVDATGQVFLLFTALLWLLAGVFARGYLADDPRAPQFFVYYALAMTGNIGLVLSQDMASFYTFFALMSFASYPLIIHQRDAEALRAGRVYIVLVVVGEAMLLAGMLLAMVAQESLLFGIGTKSLAASPAAYWICGLLLVGFGIKVGLVPLHVWLPLAYPAAPTPASAVLSGAMIKAGLLGWLRFLPLGEAALPAWGNVCLAAGLLTAFYGVIVGLTQQNAKSVLAYSSISQMGLIALGLGGGLLVPEAWPSISAAVLIYAMHHGLTKGCLFLNVGVASAAAGSSWRCRFMQVGLVIPALVMAGAPLTIGAASKTSLKYSLAALPDHWTSALDWLLPLASVGTTLLMARFLYLIWPRSEPAAKTQKATVLLSWFALLVAVLTAAWILPTGVSQATAASLLAKTLTWANLWPLGVGAAAAWVAWRLAARRKLPHYPAIPAGDILAASRRILQLLAPRARSMLDKIEPPCSPLLSPAREAIDRSVRSFISSAESAMAHWSWVAVSLVILIGAYYFFWFNPS